MFAIPLPVKIRRPPGRSSRSQLFLKSNPLTGRDFPLPSPLPRTPSFLPFPPHMGGPTLLKAVFLEFFVSVVYDVLVGWFLIVFWGSLSLFSERKCVLGGGTRIWKTSVAPRRGALFYYLYVFMLSRVFELFGALRGPPKEVPRVPLDVPRASTMGKTFPQDPPFTLRFPLPAADRSYSRPFCYMMFSLGGF